MTHRVGVVSTMISTCLGVGWFSEAWPCSTSLTLIMCSSLVELKQCVIEHMLNDKCME
jgi:hypothetical protein